MGASIVGGLSRYPSVWQKYFETLGTLNLGVGGDKTEHVQWRIANGEVPRHMKYAVIHCGSNNLDRDRPHKIADDLVKIGLTFLDARPAAYIFIHGLIPRDVSPFSSRRAKIRDVNSIVRNACNLSDKMIYIEPANDFCWPDGTLNNALYYDSLHLVEAGNEVMARSISDALLRQMNENMVMLGRLNPVINSYAIGEF